MSDVIDGEAAANAVVWELPKLGGTRGAGGAPVTARELDELERGAYQEGFERGRADGHAAGITKARDDIAQLRRLLAHFQRPLAEVSNELEQLVVTLTTSVAGALVRERAAKEPQIVLALVREALSALPSGAREVEVQLHPEDLGLLQPLLTEPEATLKLTPAPLMARGDVRVHSDVVRLDATLNTRLANAAEALLAR